MSDTEFYLRDPVGLCVGQFCIVGVVSEFCICTYRSLNSTVLTVLYHATIGYIESAKVYPFRNLGQR